jgi:hypothetical protein
LRGLTKNIGLIGALAVGCLIAAQASSAPAPTLFRLTIAGSAHQGWAYTAAPAQLGECSRKEMSEGIRNAKFATKRPIVVRLAGGRVLPVDVGGINGTVILGGANTTEEQCGETGTAKIADCAQTTRSFAGARVRISSPRPGVVALTPIRNIRLRTADCPSEPVDVTRRQLGPVPGPLNLPKAALMERKVASIRLSGSRTQRKTYALPEAGRLEERAEWTLTFVRVKSSSR